MKKTFILLSVLVIGIFLSSFGFSQEVGIISSVGDAKVEVSPGTGLKACKPGLALKEGSKIVTGKDSSVEIAFNKDLSNMVEVGENSHVIVKLEGDEKIELINGEIFSVIEGLEPGEGFKVKTPCAVCAVRGTGWNTKTDGKNTNVESAKDTVKVFGINKDGTTKKKGYSVRQGYKRGIEKFKDPGKMKKMTRKRYKALKNKFKKIAGQSKSKKNEMKKKTKMQKKIDSTKDQRRKSTRDLQDQKRIQKLKDKKKEPYNSGSSGGSLVAS